MEPLWHRICGPTDIQGRSQNLRHFNPGMGLKLGVFGFFLNQNNRDLSGAYCGLSVKVNTCKMPHGSAKIVDAFCLRVFPRVWSAKKRIPPIWASWLTTPLHRAVYEVWVLPCISVVGPLSSVCVTTAGFVLSHAFNLIKNECKGKLT